MEKENPDKILQPNPVYLSQFPPRDFEEDEIDLIEIFRVLWKRKTIIFAFTILAAVASVLISLIMPNIYQSDAVLIARESSKTPNLSVLGGLGGMVASELGIGGNGSMEEMQAILKSKRLLFGIIKKKDILKRLFPKKWDKKKKSWKEPDEAPTIQDGYKALTNILSLNYDKKLGTLTIAIQNENPKFAKKLVEWLVQGLSETLRRRTLDDAGENIKFFKKEIKKTDDPLLKEKLYNSLAKEIERRTFAMAQRYYGFNILDYPIIPDKNKKVKPKRALICIVSTITAFFISVFFVFLLQYVEDVRNRLQE